MSTRADEADQRAARARRCRSTQGVRRGADRPAHLGSRDRVERREHAAHQGEQVSDERPWLQREVDAGQHDHGHERSAMPTTPGGGRRGPGPGDQRDPDRLGRRRWRSRRPPRCSAGSASRWRSAGPAAARRRGPTIVRGGACRPARRGGGAGRTDRSRAPPAGCATSPPPARARQPPSADPRSRRRGSRRPSAACRHAAVKTSPDFAGGRGEECWLTFNTARWHLFVSDTGLAYF